MRFSWSLIWETLGKQVSKIASSILIAVVILWITALAKEQKWFDHPSAQLNYITTLARSLLDSAWVHWGGGIALGILLGDWRQRIRQRPITSDDSGNVDSTPDNDESDKFRSWLLSDWFKVSEAATLWVGRLPSGSYLIDQSKYPEIIAAESLITSTLRQKLDSSDNPLADYGGSLWNSRVSRADLLKLAEEKGVRPKFLFPVSQYSNWQASGLHVGSVTVSMEMLTKELYFELAFHLFNASGYPISVRLAGGCVCFEKTLVENFAAAIDLPQPILLERGDVPKLYPNMTSRIVLVRQSVPSNISEMIATLLADGRQPLFTLNKLNLIASALGNEGINTRVEVPDAIKIFRDGSRIQVETVAILKGAANVSPASSTGKT